jgi:hypothetical protein
MYACIPRRRDVSLEYFHDHWRHPHGTMGRLVPTLRRYVQSHRIECDLFEDEPVRFDGCAEVWFDDEAAASGFATQPYYVSDIVPDEKLFIDAENLSFVFAREEKMTPSSDLSDLDQSWCQDEGRSNAVKILQLIHIDGEEPWDREDDVALGRDIGALRHVRSRPIPHMHPDGAFVVGIRELVWPTLRDLREGAGRNLDAWHALLRRGQKTTTFAATAERFK